MSRIRLLGALSVIAGMGEFNKMCTDMERSFEGKHSVIYIPQHKKPRTKPRKERRR